MNSSGFTLQVAAVSFCLTCCIFFILNLVLGLQISRSVHSKRLDLVSNAESREEAVNRALDLTDAPADLGDVVFISNAMSPGATCLEQLVSLTQGLTGSSEANSDSAFVASKLAGDIHGWPMFWKSADPVSGKQYLNAVANFDPTWQSKVNNAQGRNAESAREFVAKYFDLCATYTRPSTRMLVRLNGPIQWLICFISNMVLILCLKRLAVLSHLFESGFFGESKSEKGKSLLPSLWWRFASLIDYDVREIRAGLPSATAALDICDQESDLQKAIYSQLSYLVGILPSLGFIGTVVGMSEALMRANSLFDSPDKTAAISNITSQLGYAFDTTLVGLLAVIIVGSCVTATRIYEFRLWREARRGGQLN